MCRPPGTVLEACGDAPGNRSRTGARSLREAFNLPASGRWAWPSFCAATRFNREIGLDRNKQYNIRGSFTMTRDYHHFFAFLVVVSFASSAFCGGQNVARHQGAFRRQDARRLESDRFWRPGQGRGPRADDRHGPRQRDDRRHLDRQAAAKQLRTDAGRQTVEGSDFFCTTTFPVGDKCCSFVTGGWGGSVIGLSNVDHMDASENPTSASYEFKDTWYKFRIRVTEKKIEVWINDKQVVDQDREEHAFGVRIECDPCCPLGIATYGRSVRCGISACGS